STPAAARVRRELTDARPRKAARARASCCTTRRGDQQGAAAMDLALRSYSFGMPWEQSYGFTQAIQAGPTLFISGQLSPDMEADCGVAGDFELRAGASCANRAGVLRAYDARRENVVQPTVYVKELRRYFDAVARLHAESLGAHRPTSTVLGVTDLALPPQL